MKHRQYRWTALLSLALVAWLWLAAVHVHADTSAHGSHPVCELCAGLDRAAAPPPAGLPTLSPPPGVSIGAYSAASIVAASPLAHYSSRAPPQA